MQLDVAYFRAIIRHRYLNQEEQLQYIDILGYIASGLVFATFSVRTMMSLRYIAIASNVFFVLYGYFGGLTPVLVLHIVLLPLNVYRLVEIKRTIRDLIRASTSDLNVEWLLPFMKKQTYKAGETIFHKGDHADIMYYISDGVILLDEIDIEIGKGALLGEVGLFSKERERMFAATCQTPATVYSITDTDVHQLSFENREFGVFMTRLICQRLVQNINDMRNRQLAHTEN